MEDSATIEKRSRGRPQSRCDDDTKAVIVSVADEHFRTGGYASANISAIARSAGVSTKTLYRLFPTKADLFSDAVANAITQFFLELDESSLPDAQPAEALERLMISFGRLVLSTHTIEITRLVLSESDRFPELASVFYEQAISRTSGVLEDWLRGQVELGNVLLDDPAEAAGMLRGMMAMEPQRAVMIGKLGKLTDDQIVARAKSCTKIFLRGCETERHRMAG
jgi:AcrR family transcriptional regulator